MFRNKKNISETEYNKVLEDLVLLAKDKDDIKKIYQMYFSEFQSLSDDYVMNVVIFIKRINQATITQINLKKLKLLEEYQPKHIKNSSFRYLVNLWLSIHLFKEKQFQEDEKYLKLLDKEPAFLDFKNYVLEKTGELEANEMLLKEISNILSRETILLEKKKTFEKKHKKLFRKK